MNQLNYPQKPRHIYIYIYIYIYIFIYLYIYFIYIYIYCTMMFSKKLVEKRSLRHLRNDTVLDQAVYESQT